MVEDEPEPRLLGGREEKPQDSARASLSPEGPPPSQHTRCTRLPHEDADLPRTGLGDSGFNPETGCHTHSAPFSARKAWPSLKASPSHSELGFRAQIWGLAPAPERAPGSHPTFLQRRACLPRTPRRRSSPGCCWGWPSRRWTPRCGGRTASDGGRGGRARLSDKGPRGCGATDCVGRKPTALPGAGLTNALNVSESDGQGSSR